MKKRIWELDALRGLCVLGMVAVHAVFDMVKLYKLVSWEYPRWFSFVQNWGGVLFLLISGICVTLGRHNIRRGLIVFAAGMLCSAVTYGMYYYGFADRGMIIYFGVLHCLGVCMILWQSCKKLPWWLLAALGAVLTALGLIFGEMPGLSHPWLTLLGLPMEGFRSSDYFPLLPYFGFFLLGAALGKTLYREKQSLLPKVNEKFLPIRFLVGVGKLSLWIYLLHQPLLSVIFGLIKQQQ